MSQHRSEEDQKNSEYLLEGMFQGISIALFGGPAFIIGLVKGLVKGWVSLSVLFVLCGLVYFGTKKLISSKQLLMGVDRGEF